VPCATPLWTRSVRHTPQLAARWRSVSPFAPRCNGQALAAGTDEAPGPLVPRRCPHHSPDAARIPTGSMTGGIARTVTPGPQPTPRATDVRVAVPPAGQPAAPADDHSRPPGAGSWEQPHNPPPPPLTPSNRPGTLHGRPTTCVGRHKAAAAVEVSGRAARHTAAVRRLGPRRGGAATITAAACARRGEERGGRGGEHRQRDGAIAGARQSPGRTNRNTGARQEAARVGERHQPAGNSWALGTRTAEGDASSAGCRAPSTINIWSMNEVTERFIYKYSDFSL